MRLGGTRHTGAGAEVGLEIACLLVRMSRAFLYWECEQRTIYTKISRKRVKNELANESAFQ
jgi:hypothetical protein